MDLTPKQIVIELDKHVVGQSKAKRAVAIALRNSVSVLSNYGDYFDSKGEWSPNATDVKEGMESGSSSSSSDGQGVNIDKKLTEGQNAGVVSLKTSRFGETTSWQHRRSIEKQQGGMLAKNIVGVKAKNIVGVTIDSESGKS